MSTLFAGLDWASRTHAVCVIDECGAVRAQFEVSHDAAGLAELRRKLGAYGSIRVAIERPSGLIVDALVEFGFTVVPIHPNIVKATRPRYRSHGAKSDASDAYLLADLLRTDGHRFAPLAPQSDELRALRALVRGRDDLVATRLQLANQLRSLLESFRPRSSTKPTRRSRWPSSSAIPRPRPPSVWAPSAWPPSARSTPTAAGAAPRRCSRGCTKLRPLRSTSWRWRPRANSR